MVNNFVVALQLQTVVSMSSYDTRIFFPELFPARIYLLDICTMRARARTREQSRLVITTILSYSRIVDNGKCGTTLVYAFSAASSRYIYVNVRREEMLAKALFVA